jgi:tartrate/fumarate subfamily iron-sulfur-dependent hydro-lyase beta chain
MIRRIELPASPADIGAWRAGDLIRLSGVVFTARDLAHRCLFEAAKHGLELPFDPTSLPIFHCGPLARRDDSRWTIAGLGPTSSARMEATTPTIMAHFATPFLIGKGGMGETTRKALVERGSAYLAAVGGTGALGARAVAEVLDVVWLEDLGMPDAVWILRLDDYGPLVVSMDSQGRDLHEETVRAAQERLVGADQP